jgi:hypothetical protein
MITDPQQMRALVHELTQATWSLAAIGALIDSGLADQLVEARTLDELAAGCRAFSARRIEKLVAVAAVHGIVVAEGGRYKLADGAKTVVCGPMRATVAGEIRSHLMQPVAMLDTARAAAPTTGWSFTDPAILQAQGDSSGVLPMMVKMQLAPMMGDLATRIARPGAKLLDVGTGVGSLAIAACRVFPELKVVGLDIADAPLALARVNVAKAGLAERVELRQVAVQDLADDGAFAFAWLPAFFIPDELLPRAIARVAAALEPGGWVLMGSPGGGEPKQRAINELVGDVWGGPSISAPAAEELMRGAGLVDVRTLPGPAWAPQMLAGRRA